MNWILSIKLDSQLSIWNGSKMINLCLLEEMGSYCIINYTLQAIQPVVKFLSNARLRRRNDWIKCKKLRHKLSLVLIQVSMWQVSQFNLLTKAIRYVWAVYWMESWCWLMLKMQTPHKLTASIKIQFVA